MGGVKTKKLKKHNLFYHKLLFLHKMKIEASYSVVMRKFFRTKSFHYETGTKLG